MRAATEDPPAYGAGEDTDLCEWELRRVGAMPANLAVLRTPAEAGALVAGILRGLDHERLIVLHLDGRHRVTGWHEAARGSANVVHVVPRSVLRLVIRRGAVAFIVGHNHPSGDPTPSQDDHDLTARLRAAGDVVGIPLLDHIVVGETAFYSFADSAQRNL